MNCRKARRLIFDFIDGALSDKDKVRLDSHLARCSSCEALAARLQESLDLVHNLPEELPSNNFNWKVRLLLAKERRSLEKEIASGGLWVKKWNARFALAAGATFALVMFAGYLFLSSYMTSPGDVALEKSRPKSSRTASPPAVAEQSRAWSNYPQTLPYSPAVRERFVSGGSWHAPSGYDYYRPIEEVPSAAIINPDSLVVSKLRDMRMQYRVRYLEQQIELLQRYLRKCQTERK